MGDAYGTWLKDDLGGVIDSLGLTELQQKFLTSRWLDQVVWMEGKASYSQKRYYGLRLVTIIAGVLVPGLVSLSINDHTASSAIGWATFSVSLLVAFAAALEEFFHYGERWRHYRRTVEALKSQGWQFFELAGTYSRYETHAAAFARFAARVEMLLEQDVERYVTQVVQEKKHDRSEGDGS